MVFKAWHSGDFEIVQKDTIKLLILINSRFIRFTGECYDMDTFGYYFNSNSLDDIIVLLLVVSGIVFFILIENLLIFFDVF